MFMNIEAQGKDNMGYPLLKRSIYYGSRLLVRQKNTPNGFQKTNYEDLKKVYSIWICMKHSKKKSGVMNRYSCMKNIWEQPMHFKEDIMI